MRMVCIGDSLVYGYGVRRGDAWSSLLSHALPNVEIINRGVSGETSGEVLSRFERDVFRNDPDVVFCMCGSNDIFFERDVKTAEMNIESMRELCERHQVTFIFGVPIPVEESCMAQEWIPYAFGENVQKQMTEYRKWLIAYGEACGFPVWDFWEMMPERGKRRDRIYLDGLHLNDLGNRIFALYVEKRLIQEGMFRNIKKNDI